MSNSYSLAVLEDYLVDASIAMDHNQIEDAKEFVDKAFRMVEQLRNLENLRNLQDRVAKRK